MRYDVECSYHVPEPKSETPRATGQITITAYHVPRHHHRLFDTDNETSYMHCELLVYCRVM